MNKRVHGGPDAAGAAQWDFSTNANARGPCAVAADAVREADASRYPDPAYTQLRVRLAALHGVDASRIVLAASASEFIFRVTAAVDGTVWRPAHSYGDYADAARAHGCEFAVKAEDAGLVWLCEPSSPQGAPVGAAAGAAFKAGSTVVLDRAYEPLRLSGASSFTPEQLDRMWQLWTPNKALGLTGVRAAYAVAPVRHWVMTERLESLAPSWPIGSHGVAMLSAWCEPKVRGWLAASLHFLREWKTRQVALCESLGWQVTPSETNYFCAKPDRMDLLPALREKGVQLRDAESFGLPGHVRLSVQKPAAQDALAAAWRELGGKQP